jgi:hypothetical protein
MSTEIAVESLLRSDRTARNSIWRTRIIAFLWQWLVLSLTIEIVLIPTLLLTYRISRFGFNLFDNLTEILSILGIYGLTPAVLLPLIWIVVALLSKIIPDLSQRLLPASRPSTQSLEKVEVLIKQRSTLNAKQLPVLDRLTVMNEIDERVNRLRSRTAFILSAIAFALIAAAIVVLFAGRLTSIDAEAVSNVDRGKTELSDATRNLTRLYKHEALFHQLDSLNKQLESVTLEPNKRIDLEKQIVEKKKEVDSFGSAYGFRDTASIPVDANSASSMISMQSAEVASLRTLVDEALKKELLADHGYGDWRYIVATAITRVGVVLIIVFLVQILMGLYRYNTKLIAYYNSRRDLLTLWDGKQSALVSLDRTLSLPPIDFGKEPKHPLEDIMRAVGGKLSNEASPRASQKR